MVIDPIANLWAQADDGTEYAYEMSDPVEEDIFLVDGIKMSNFVHRPGSNHSSIRPVQNSITSACLRNHSA
jgi:hypothetical protein